MSSNRFSNPSVISSRFAGVDRLVKKFLPGIYLSAQSCSSIGIWEPNFVNWCSIALTLCRHFWFPVTIAIRKINMCPNMCILQSAPWIFSVRPWASLNQMWLFLLADQGFHTWRLYQDLWYTHMKISATLTIIRDHLSSISTSTYSCWVFNNRV
jgi:hypothetical protein